ncbi:hypothetical protein LPY66_10240 [Dehalobacter sp. DCM]|uniref:hypothetical protein n=1 Tax=Dehalobacter sp. DCM TaxID=2907827 RepID=UPI003081A518|nr:hypothetical protein LPY66_10240 [Dehalobacter sp. DCM]
MATKNSMTPSGGIFQSHQGVPHGVGISPMTIQQQIIQDAQKQAQERWKILRETQSKIFEIQQDITAHRARTGDIARRAWEQYIRQ